MQTHIKIFITFFILSLAFFCIYAKAATCPPINTIKRISGEYQWVTSEPGWNGYFIAPNAGRGRSYTVKSFLAASWVKTYDTIDSAGFIQCDYVGDFGSPEKSRINAQNNQIVISNNQKPNNNQPNNNQPNNNQANAAPTVIVQAPTNDLEYEIIRFVQVGSNGATEPNKTSWSCKAINTYPGEACSCYSGVDKCSFRLG
jgi:hypothetical protein